LTWLRFSGEKEGRQLLLAPRVAMQRYEIFVRTATICERRHASGRKKTCDVRASWAAHLLYGDSNDSMQACIVRKWLKQIDIDAEIS
jgi:hypothetical protein